jgi:hypothetical protein
VEAMPGRAITCISTYTRRGDDIVLFLLPLALAGAPANAAASPLSSYIEKLGTVDASSQLRYIDQYGCAAGPALIASLKIVPSGHYVQTGSSDETLRTIYVIAALRYITGRDFYGPVSRRQLMHYDKMGRQFLTQGAPAAHTKFFGWWMSRGSFYLAPESAQAKIISEWRSYIHLGKCRHSSWAGRSFSEFYLGGSR